MNNSNKSIIAIAPDGIGRTLIAENRFGDLFKSNGKEISKFTRE